MAERLLASQSLMCTAESCTGGLIAAVCTELPGSSEWFDRGFVTYSNAAKQDMLGVSATLIATHGAVSEPVAVAMAEGALARAGTTTGWAVAVTGIAGPSGGSASKPVGTVWIAWAGPGGTKAQGYVFAGSREEVRAQTVEHALQGLLKALQMPSL